MFCVPSAEIISGAPTMELPFVNTSAMPWKSWLVALVTRTAVRPRPATK